MTVSTSFGQLVDLQKDVKINDDDSYFWGLKLSGNQNYILANQGYIGAFLLDTNLAVKQHIPYVCGACGAGKGRISKDEKYFIGYARNFTDEKDTLILIELSTGLTRRVVVPMMAQYAFIENPNRLLINDKGVFYTYDLESKKRKKVLNLYSSTKPYSTQFITIRNDSFLIFHSPEGRLDVFETKTWKRVKSDKASKESFWSFAESPSGKFYLYTIDNTYFIHDSYTHEIIESNTLEVKDLLYFKLSEDDQFLMFIDIEHNIGYCKRNVKDYNIILKSSDHIEYHGLMLYPDNRRFITGINGNRLVVYSLEDDHGQLVNHAEPFQYSVDEADTMTDLAIKIEKALRLKGHNVPLDNFISAADEKILRAIQEENNLSGRVDGEDMLLFLVTE